MAASLSSEQRRILADATRPRFLASVDRRGEPNLVPVLSLRLYEPGVISFVEFVSGKTRRNLDETGDAALVVLGPDQDYFTARGTLSGRHTAGPIYEAVAGQPVLGWNSRFRIQAVATIALAGVEDVGRLSATSPLVARVCARWWRRALARDTAAGGVGGAPEPAGGPADGLGAMPPRVAEKFARLAAAKAVAWPVADGVRVLPASGVTSLGPARLVVSDRCVLEAVPDGSRVAVAVMTPELVAYQVKGTAHHRRNLLLVDVAEVYTACPPSPGRLCRPAVGREAPLTPGQPSTTARTLCTPATGEPPPCPASSSQP